MPISLLETSNCPSEFQSGPVLAGSKASIRSPYNSFFSEVQGVLDDLGFDETMLSRLWNGDETGISNVAEIEKVVCTKGARQIRKATSGGRGSNVTVMCAMNAVGGFGVPPFFIFPRKRMNAAHMANTPP